MNGPHALAAGASSGLGYEFARLCVEHGHDIDRRLHEQGPGRRRRNAQFGLAELHRGMAEPGSGKN